MPKRKTIHDLATTTDGIVLIMLQVAGATDVAGADASAVLLADLEGATEAALSIFDHVSPPNGYRVAVTEFEGRKPLTIHALASGDARMAVVAHTNHPVAKGIKRMMRKILSRANENSPAQAAPHDSPEPSPDKPTWL